MVYAPYISIVKTVIILNQILHEQYDRIQSYQPKYTIVYYHKRSSRPSTWVAIAQADYSDIEIKLEKLTV